MRISSTDVGSVHCRLFVIAWPRNVPDVSRMPSKMSSPGYLSIATPVGSRASQPPLKCDVTRVPSLKCKMRCADFLGPEDEWGGKQKERELVVRLHQTKEDIPKNGIIIDATAPLARVVDEIVRQCEANTTLVD